MAKHFTSQRYVYKLHSARLRRANWSLQLTINQARENRELIALSDSQIMRFIDELNGIASSGDRIAAIRAQIKLLKSEKNLAISRPKIKKLYQELDHCQFKKDYVCVIMDNNNDYRKMYKNGFRINGITYRRLLGTTGGVKTNTIVFVNEKLLPELKERINNGRDLSKSFTPAKLEAYMSLVCSASISVSMPKGVVVVPDCITHFKSDVIELDDTGLEEPSMRYIREQEITLKDSDGYGLAMPKLMKRWGAEIGENFLLPGCVIRNSFCKGAVFPVDFQKFAKDHRITTITDVWNHTYPIENIELVLTESMLKLWNSYASMEDYLKNCEKHHYSFAITKASGEHLEHQRTMNYQFLQSYQFSEVQLDELIAPTVNEIKDILSEDYRKTLLYTKGTGFGEHKLPQLDSSFSTALMIEPELMHDPYVKSQIRNMIQKRIDEAKVGVLNVPGNYSLISGDPYSLCQSMLGLEVTGLLKSGQVYSKYWVEHGVKKIVSFRAPMTSHNNIRVLEVVHSPEMDEFYRYMTTPTIFNSWDTCADAMNGFDKDGDCVINTSFPLLVNNTRPLPAVVCVQHKAPECIPGEEELMQSNINSFGNAVGEITNKITSMFEVQARFAPDTREYRILDYRIKCGQLYQQNAIDKTKGIEAKPMPEHWYRQSSRTPDENTAASIQKEQWINQSLTADKKPYFMQYIYPSERTKLNTYKKKNQEKCLLRFRVTLDELLKKTNRTPEEEAFIRYYEHGMPLGTAPCTVNKICWKIEEIFDTLDASGNDTFDYSILKCHVDYSSQLFKKVKKIYEQYQKETADYMQYAKSERIKPEDRQTQRYLLKEQFKRKCLEVCPNEEFLCDIVLDLCYPKSNCSKQFAWDICGDTFIQNLLKQHDYTISYPAAEETGEITFQGRRFTMKTRKLNANIYQEDDE